MRRKRPKPDALGFAKSRRTRKTWPSCFHRQLILSCHFCGFATSGWLHPATFNRTSLGAGPVELYINTSGRSVTQTSADHGCVMGTCLVLLALSVTDTMLFPEKERV